MGCFGPSQSHTTHLARVIQLRFGGGSDARFSRDTWSMVICEKKAGWTASADSIPPRIKVLTTTELPPLAWKRRNVTRATRNSPAMAGSDPIGNSVP